MKHTGYFVVDDTASGGGKYEADTRLCKHCQAVLVVGTPAGAFCMKCGGPVCATGPCATTCTPVTKAIDDALRLANRAGVGLSRPRRNAIASHAASIQRQLQRAELRAAMGLEGTR